MSALFYENLFCLYFSPDNIHHLLCGYEEDYQELLINIYEPVLTSAIGCVLAGTDARMLDLSGYGAEYLNRFFVGKTKAGILAAIEEIKAILYELSLPEIAALSKKYSIMSEIETIEFRDKEQVLRECLNDYVSALSQEQRDFFRSITLHLV